MGFFPNPIQDDPLFSLILGKKFVLTVHFTSEFMSFYVERE